MGGGEKAEHIMLKKYTFMRSKRNGLADIQCAIG